MDLFTRGPGRNPTGRIGQCIFADGLTGAILWYMGNFDHPDGFVRIVWTNLDGYMDDNCNDCFDLYNYIYNACSKKLSVLRVLRQYEENCNPVTEERCWWIPRCTDEKPCLAGWGGWTPCEPPEEWLVTDGVLICGADNVLFRKWNLAVYIILRPEDQDLGDKDFICPSQLKKQIFRA